MTRKQKRMLVRLRLMQSDAAAMSDRALARELGVSQPFVGAQRRLVAPRPMIVIEAEPPSEWIPERITTAQEALDRHHDQWSALGRVRRVSWPVESDNSRARTDWDPIA